MVSDSFPGDMGRRRCSVVLRIVVGLLFLEHGLSKYFRLSRAQSGVVSGDGHSWMAGAIGDRG